MANSKSWTLSGFSRAFNVETREIVRTKRTMSDGTKYDFCTIEYVTEDGDIITVAGPQDESSLGFSMQGRSASSVAADIKNAADNLRIIERTFTKGTREGQTCYTLVHSKFENEDERVSF